MQTTYRTRQRAVVLSFLINSGNCHTAEEIIKAHNGILNYESKEGQYTKVTITLPLNQN